MGCGSNFAVPQVLSNSNSFSRLLATFILKCRLPIVSYAVKIQKELERIRTRTLFRFDIAVDSWKWMVDRGNRGKLRLPHSFGAEVTRHTPFRQRDICRSDTRDT